MPWPPEDPNMWAVEARFKGKPTVDETQVEQRRLDAQERNAALGERKAQKKLPVMEIFGPTIQGEGLLCGVRTTFIRFGLCDYKCTMCDSMHAVDPLRVQANATYMTQAEAAKDIFALHDIDAPIPKCKWITFSGGNPCMHDLSELVHRLKSRGIKIAVETQGTLLPNWLSMCDVVTVSPKSPGMGEKFELDKFSNFLWRFGHHKGFNVKVVVFSMADIEWLRPINDMMVELGLEDRMYLSLGNPYPPGKDIEEDRDWEGTTRDKISDDALKLRLLENYQQLTEDLLQLPDMQNVKFLPQLHVLAWGNKQGV